VVTLKSLSGVFALREVFLSCQQIIVSNLFFAAFNIFGDLLVPPRFTCNLT